MKLGAPVFRPASRPQAAKLPSVQLPALPGTGNARLDWQAAKLPSCSQEGNRLWSEPPPHAVERASSPGGGEAPLTRRVLGGTGYFPKRNAERRSPAPGGLRAVQAALRNRGANAAWHRFTTGCYGTDLIGDGETLGCHCQARETPSPNRQTPDPAQTPTGGFLRWKSVACWYAWASVRISVSP